MTFQIVSMLLCVVLAANFYFANIFNAQKVAVFATRALATLSVLCVICCCFVKAQSQLLFLKYFDLIFLCHDQNQYIF